LDALWAASQAQADLLLAVGAPTLIQGILNQPSNVAVAASAPSPLPAASPSPFTSASRNRSQEPVDHAHPLSWMNLTNLKQPERQGEGIVRP
ncbi:MAG: hypothetical protein ACXVBB_11075, partial [Isosphaeraceae bacterium]